MKKKMFPALFLSVGLACGIAIGASAAGTLQEVKAYLNSGVTVTLDGEAQTFTNVQGARVYPITYEGTTYLPVRAVAGLVGLNVDWDQATQTVKLGQSKGVDLIDDLKPYTIEHGNYVQSASKQTRDISGASYSHWLCLSSIWGRNCSASYNLEGKYSTLTFKYYSDGDCTLDVLGDNGSVLASIPVKGGQVTQTITVDLLNTTQLTFKADGLWKDLCIFDAHLA